MSKTRNWLDDHFPRLLGNVHYSRSRFSKRVQKKGGPARVPRRLTGFMAIEGFQWSSPGASGDRSLGQLQLVKWSCNCSCDELKIWGLFFTNMSKNRCMSEKKTGDQRSDWATEIAGSEMGSEYNVKTKSPEKMTAQGCSGEPTCELQNFTPSLNQSPGTMIPTLIGNRLRIASLSSWPRLPLVAIAQRMDRFTKKKVSLVPSGNLT